MKTGHDYIESSATDPDEGSSMRAVGWSARRAAKRPCTDEVCA